MSETSLLFHAFKQIVLHFLIAICSYFLHKKNESYKSSEGVLMEFDVQREDCNSDEEYMQALIGELVLKLKENNPAIMALYNEFLSSLTDREERELYGLAPLATNENAGYKTPHEPSIEWVSRFALQFCQYRNKNSSSS